MIHEIIGVCLDCTVPHYEDFQDDAHMLPFGRVTTGKGGDIVLSKAREVPEKEFSETAAASLPNIPEQSAS